MGWMAIRDKQSDSPAACCPPPFSTAAYHSGGAIGASSAILILPQEEIVVAVFCNLQNVGFLDLSGQIASGFAKRLCNHDNPVILPDSKAETSDI